MVDLDKMLELLEEKRQLLLAFEAVTQVMLTCQEEQLGEQLKGRQRLLERLQELETELAELCSRAGEDGALARAAAQAKAEPSALPEELGPVTGRRWRPRQFSAVFRKARSRPLCACAWSRSGFWSRLRAPTRAAPPRPPGFIRWAPGKEGAAV